MSKKAIGGVLIGRFERKLDAMRRARIPSVWFALMGQPKRVVVMAHPKEKCLVLLSEAEYVAQVRQMRRQASKSEEARQELRILEGEVEHLDVNARHCIRISDKWLRFAAIKERVVFSGAIRYANLWNPKLLQRNEEITDRELEAVLKKLGFGSTDN